MKVTWPLFKNRPSVKKIRIVDMLLCLSVYVCQPLSKIFIGFGLTVYPENSLQMISAEKKVKGNVCCLTKWQTI